MKILAAVVVGSMMFLTFFPLVNAEETVQTDSLVSDPAGAASTTQASGPTDDYKALEKEIKQDRLADALERLRVVEQDVRFLRRRVELLERDVNDIKNDRYNRVNP